MGQLRQEILQSEQTRSDLLKWKLGLVGAISAVGLGLAGSRAPAHADLVLCAVPIVCLYVDFLCRHLNLRILVIGTFLASDWMAAATRAGTSEFAVFKAYEEHVQRARRLRRRLLRPRDLIPKSWRWHGAFGLEDGAVSWSTALLSVALIVYGVDVRDGHTVDHGHVGAVFIAAGVAGVAGSLIGVYLYTRKFGQVLELDHPRDDDADGAGGTPAREHS
jgi:hypothetical protein